jgi:serine/threonine-protein kinase
VSTDIYAATGVLVTAMTARPPYLGTDLSGLGVQHTQGALPSEAVPLLARELVIRGLAKDPRDRPASAGLFRRDVEVAGTAFLGATWRDQGRAWLAVVVAERLAEPVPTAAPVEEFLDDDDDAPLSGVAIDSAADTPRPGGVGWKVWSVAAAAVIALVVMVVVAVQALGGPGVQSSPTVPPAPVITASTGAAVPTNAGVPTSIDTAGDAPDSPTPSPTAGPTPTTAPNTMPVTIAPSPTPTPTATPSPSPTHKHHAPPTPTPI